jgi:hypothetical protein
LLKWLNAAKGPHYLFYRETLDVWIETLRSAHHGLGDNFNWGLFSARRLLGTRTPLQIGGGFRHLSPPVAGHLRRRSEFLVTYILTGLHQTFVFHSAFRSIFLSHTSVSASLALKSISLKWTNFIFFLINFFHCDGFFLSLGSSLIRQEVEALNWGTKVWQVNEWLHFRTHFTTVSKRRNEFGEFLFRKFGEESRCVFFFSDSIAQLANIQYLNRLLYTTVGVVDMSSNPWLFTFALPITFSSVAMQVFSLRVLLNVRKVAHSMRFQENIQFFKKLL